MRRILLTIVPFLFPIILSAQQTTPSAPEFDSTAKIANIIRENPDEVAAYYSPPSVYFKWWKEVRVCTNTKDVPEKRFYDLKWAHVRADGFLASGRGPYIGYTYAWLNEIWIIDDRVLDKQVVKHEMLHFLLWNQGKVAADHPPIFFKCNLMPS